MVVFLMGMEMEKRDVPIMRVVCNDDGELYTLDNRRLAMFRLLEFIGRAARVEHLGSDFVEGDCALFELHSLLQQQAAN